MTEENTNTLKQNSGEKDELLEEEMTEDEIEDLDNKEPTMCDCGECAKCIEETGSCDCGDCDICEVSEEVNPMEIMDAEDVYDDLEPEDLI